MQTSVQRAQEVCAGLRSGKSYINESLVCGVTQSWNPSDDPDQEKVVTDYVVPVAGDFTTSTGKSLDPQWTRLKSSDADTEGLQLEMVGGVYNKRKQKAVVQFQCDKKRTGNEGNDESKRRRRSDKDKNDKEKDDDENSLTFVSYAAVEGKEDMDVLRLNWRTKYACEDFEEDDGDNQSKKTSGWGFFTWFILM